MMLEFNFASVYDEIGRLNYLTNVAFYSILAFKLRSVFQLHNYCSFETVGNSCYLS